MIRLLSVSEHVKIANILIYMSNKDTMDKKDSAFEDWGAVNKYDSFDLTTCVSMIGRVSADDILLNAENAEDELERLRSQLISLEKTILSLDIGLVSKLNRVAADYFRLEMQETLLDENRPFKQVDLKIGILKKIIKEWQTPVRKLTELIINKAPKSKTRPANWRTRYIAILDQLQISDCWGTVRQNYLRGAGRLCSFVE